MEGLDRSGKSSQCSKLACYLGTQGFPVDAWWFPRRWYLLICPTKNILMTKPFILHSMPILSWACKLCWFKPQILFVQKQEGSLWELLVNPSPKIVLILFAPHIIFNIEKESQRGFNGSFLPNMILSFMHPDASTHPVKDKFLWVNMWDFQVEKNQRWLVTELIAIVFKNLLA